MKSKRLIYMVSCFLFFLLSSCNKTETISALYSADTGDTIEIVLEITDGLDLLVEQNFTIMKDETDLMYGRFIPSVDYDGYVAVVNRSEECEVIETGTKDGNEYIQWIYDDIEYNFGVKVKNSQTAIIMSSFLSQEAAEECFYQLSFYVYE